MRVYTAKPSDSLAPFVRSYALRTARVAHEPIHFPLPARSDCFLEFYLRDRYRILTTSTGEIHLSPHAVLVGPHTRRLEDLLYTGTLQVFNIQFTPIGFRALFGIPTRHIVNSGQPAAAVLGKAADELADRLFSSDGSFATLSRIADNFLTRRLLHGSAPLRSRHIHGMAQAIRKTHGSIDMHRIAAHFERSTRQMERDFVEHVGISPKVFARLERLNYALRLKSSAPQNSWADVAATAGYFDQAHLGRDFREMTGETPTRFLALRQPGMTVWQTRPTPLPSEHLPAEHLPIMSQIS